jgi:hypothetical protein
MVQVENIIQVFNYLNDTYGLNNGIYVKVQNAVPVFEYIWPVQDSNLTFKFGSLQMFEHAYNMIQNSNTEIECITYKSNFVTFKYYPSLKRAFLATEDFSTITHLHTMLNQQGVKEILYKFTNANN